MKITERVWLRKPSKENKHTENSKTEVILLIKLIAAEHTAAIEAIDESL